MRTHPPLTRKCSSSSACGKKKKNSYSWCAAQRPAAAAFFQKERWARSRRCLRSAAALRRSRSSGRARGRTAGPGRHASKPTHSDCPPSRLPRRRSAPSPTPPTATSSTTRLSSRTRTFVHRTIRFHIQDHHTPHNKRGGAAARVSRSLLRATHFQAEREERAALPKVWGSGQTVTGVFFFLPRTRRARPKAQSKGALSRVKARFSKEKTCSRVEF